ncbi:MAG: thioredoxin family protein [Gemmatimonadales bacterium]|nr:MAG: thioredoxin family protein [Gemmatimonadales bacterium]
MSEGVGPSWAGPLLVPMYFIAGPGVPWGTDDATNDTILEPPPAMTPRAPDLDPDRWKKASSLEGWIATTEKNHDLWTGLHGRVSLPEWAETAAATVEGPVRLLALTEDWCGDAVNSLPWVDHLARSAPGLEFRVLERDSHEDLMDAHLTGGTSRSIPVVIAYDEAFREMGWWGPRPSALQTWVTGPGRELEVEERYREVRKWYARDRGHEILREVLEMVGARGLPESSDTPLPVVSGAGDPDRARR